MTSTNAPHRPQSLNKVAALSKASVAPQDQIFDDFLTAILKQLPQADGLSMLQGPQNSQAPFYFKESATGDLSKNFYNSLLAPRYAGVEPLNGVKRVQQVNDQFVSTYAQLYGSLTYNLSEQDQALKQQVAAQVNDQMRGLVPLYNAWVKVAGATAKPPVTPLDERDMQVALAQLTVQMNGCWIADAYKKDFQQDSSFPYTHMQLFRKIYGNMPITLPGPVITQIETIWNSLGTLGGFQAKVSSATQALEGIKANLSDPSAANGGLRLGGTESFVPGWTFQPEQPTTIQTKLGTNPPSGSLTYSGRFSQSNSSSIAFHTSTGGSVQIPILDFFSASIGGSTETSIFEQSFAGQTFKIDVTVNNPTVDPYLSMKPLLYDFATQQGWMMIGPIQEALANGNDNTKTGYMFTGGVPKLDFGKNGDFGFLGGLILSQFLEISLTFTECKSDEVKKYFEANASASFNFLGIPLGGASASSTYESSYSNASESEITVTLKPTAPGYTPGATSADDSLCALVATVIEYPLAN